MYEQIAWQVELTVKPQLFHHFTVLTQEMTAVAATEKGILIYERFWSHDFNRVFLYERYANSQAAISHLQLFHNWFSHRLTQLANRERFLVFGEPSDELKVMLHSYGATFLELIDRLI
jgi:quinol monooxygenase YgiN